MNQQSDIPSFAIDEIVAKIRELQQEILAREERRRMGHLERLVGDWDALVARSRALSQDDIDLVAALVRLVGDLLVIQHDGVDEKWISRLGAYIANQRAKVS